MLGGMLEIFVVFGDPLVDLEPVSRAESTGVLLHDVTLDAVRDHCLANLFPSQTLSAAYLGCLVG